LEATPEVAITWRQIADDFLAMGLRDDAIEAYQRTADAAGVRPSPTTTKRSPAVAASHPERPTQQ
jgi:hypothetical protein